MRRILCALVLGTASLVPVGGALACDGHESAAQAALTTVVYAVDGMHCAGCTSKVEAEVKKLAGVTTVAADLKKKTVTVTFDATKTKSEAIRDAITKAGFKSNLAA